MADLQYYRDEREMFPEDDKTRFTDEQATIVFNKLKSKYKFRQNLVFRGNRCGGCCNISRIRLSHRPSILILAHEIAHAIQFKKFGYMKMKFMRFHGKKHNKIVKKLLIFIDSHMGEWFIKAEEKAEKHEMIEKKAQIKRQEAIAFKLSPQYKLNLWMAARRRWETKLKTAKNKLKKIERRITYYQKKVKT